jgi:hypothetical protein
LATADRDPGQRLRITPNSVTNVTSDFFTHPER